MKRPTPDQFPPKPEEGEGGECQWFALCFRPAIAYRWHPIIGDVPVCELHVDAP